MILKYSYATVREPSKKITFLVEGGGACPLRNVIFFVGSKKSLEFFSFQKLIFVYIKTNLLICPFLLIWPLKPGALKALASRSAKNVRFFGRLPFKAMCKSYE